MPDEADDTSPQPAGERPEAPGCPIVGIGASAGGIDALKRLFPNVDPDSGMAFVVVQHLDPHHGSVLAEVLARSTPIPVTPIQNTTSVDPNHVYVIPPNAALTIQDGRLLLTRPERPRGQRNPIDEFLISLARDQGENAACVILSGTGSDGTLGLRAIKEAGGLTLAQAEAEYDGMMRSAVATGLVDFILRAEEIPAKLAEYFDHVSEIGDGAGPDGVQAEISRNLGAITALLHARTGHDFSDYKDRTIIRRVQRRMHVLQIGKVSAFIDRLHHDNRETALLFQDLLIGVTGFFRDPEAFAALEREVIPELFKGKGADDIIRVWVPGCATGEEAYSIAILLRDYAPRSQTVPRLQIFATDIDENALETARIGRYAAALAKDVPSERLERYFLREDGTYRIASDVREICLFSPHNLLRDAPFSKLDLISCRNLLIYLSSDMQDRVIPLFHYSLVQDGFLFLGTSENVTRHYRLFATIDKAHRIFRKRAHLERHVPEFPLTSPAATRRTVLPMPRAAAGEITLKATAERQVLDRFAPAHVVINAEGDLLQSSGRTGKYLELPPGAPDTNVFNLARPGLRMELRAAMHKAMSGQVAMQRKVTVGTNGGTQEIDLYVQPLKFGSAAEPLYLVVFQDLGPILPPEDKEAVQTGAIEEDSVRHLEAELRATRERLQNTTEELESSNEELKSSNEELQSINEELQSANEELETSKEELQSINEELQTVNAELNARVEELSRASNDMSNLLESTQIATVFLDRGLLVKSFTPAAKDVFRLVESDTGRPIMHVRSRFEAEGLQEDAERVLRTLTTIERPVAATENGARYIMRLLPYRTTDNIINGVVITFTDITRISAAEARINELTGALRARIDELETILELVPVAVMIAQNDSDRDIRINAYGATLLGTEERREGRAPATKVYRLFQDGEEVPREMQPLERAMRTGEAVANWDGLLENGRGESTPVMISATPLFGESGTVRGAVAAIVDISLHKQAETQQQFLLSELQHRVKNILATISSLATRMLRQDPSVQEFHDSFLARLGAMSRTHDLLSSGAWSGASIRALLEAALEPYAAAAGKGNVSLTGDEVRLASQPAAALGMVFHELATNAAKYGALSRASGRVEVTWRQHQEADGESRLHLTWTEHGGPPVDTSATPGFGSAFITRCVEYELAGRAGLEFRPEGVRCTIGFPLTGHTENPPAKGSP